MNAPITYYGGKRYMVNILLPMFPIHHTYVEVFGGSGVLLLNKPRSKVETYNDIEENIVDFYRLLQNPDELQLFQEKIELTPYSKVLHKEYSDTWRQQSDRVEKIFRWYYIMKSSFNGLIDANWTYSVTRNKANIMLETVDRLPEVARRLRGVQIENSDWEQAIHNSDRPDTFFYLDPPYVLETRTGGKAYQHEMTNEDHERLVDVLLSIKGKAMLSGYDNDIYAKLNWERMEFPMHCRTPVQGEDVKITKIESVWINYSLNDTKSQQELF